MSEHFRIQAAGCGRGATVRLPIALDLRLLCGMSYQYHGNVGRAVCTDCAEQTERLNVLLQDYTVSGLENGIEMLTKHRCEPAELIERPSLAFDADFMAQRTAAEVERLRGDRERAREAGDAD